MSALPSPLESLNWDNLRIFLAVMRSKSLRQAAELLGLSHPTVRRRLEALEEQLGLRLFERRSDGLHARPEARVLLEKAEAVEASVLAFGRSASDVDPNLQGHIHITAPDIIMSDLLAPEIAAFAERWPQITLHIDTSYDIVDLGSRKADIAIRIVPQGIFPEGELAGRKAATLCAAVYGSKHQWLGWEDTERQQEDWIKHTPFADRPIGCILNNVYLQQAACIAGMGLAILPCFMGDRWMKRHTEPRAEADLWILVHTDLRRNPRMRLFRDEMVEALKRLQPLLEGKVPFSPPSSSMNLDVSQTSPRH